MIKFLDILREAKQVGDIYHFTSVDGIANMLKEYQSITLDIEYSSQAGEGYFSFTRNPNLSSLSTFQKQVRLKLNGNKMSNKYKFEPHADIKSSDSYQKGKYGEFSEFEAEERINAKNNPKVDLTPYIESVVIVSPKIIEKEYPKSSGIYKEVMDDYKKIIKWFIEKHIPITYSNKETTSSNRRAK